MIVVTPDFLLDAVQITELVVPRLRRNANERGLRIENQSTTIFVCLEDGFRRVYVGLSTQPHRSRTVQSLDAGYEYLAHRERR